MTSVKQRAIVVVLLAAGIAAVIVAKQRQGPLAPSADTLTAAMPSSPQVATTASASEKEAAPVPPSRPAARPRLVDLGADKCIPCRMMAPILDELKRTYADELQVEFIDVWKNPTAGQQYGIRVIPTQIFYGPDGKELARHEGFMSREDILALWAKLGFTFGSGGTPPINEPPRITEGL